MPVDLGIRAKVAATAAIATVVLLSLLGAIGYRAMIDAARASQIQLLNDRMDELESQLGSGDARVIASRQINSGVRVVRTGAGLPSDVPQTLRIIRDHPDPDIWAIVGVVDTRRIDDTFETIRIALWASVAVVGLLVGVTSWLVIDRALAPVRRLTRQAEANLTSPSLDAVPVEGGADELTELAQTFNAMLGRLRSVDTERRRFVSDASHELRTPLMVLGADAEFALDHPHESVSAGDLARSVLAQTRRLTDLVDDLLTLASLDEAESPPLSTTTLGDLMTKSNARPVLSELSPEFEAVAVPDVSRSLGNLVANGHRYGRNTVEVLVAVDQTMVTFMVDDDGPGVPLDERAGIFTRFYRPDGDRNRAGGGAGLGLAIAKAEVVRAGGSVVVEDSSSLGGARFTLSIPRNDCGQSGQSP